ncbi:hypothetical protein, partial [Mameliella sediminis]|uniref:hypothetical protein n=1 Tax=Mameliella sediminis TaxID=2836866 RepID=UPI001C4388C3
SDCCLAEPWSIAPPSRPASRQRLSAAGEGAFTDTNINPQAVFFMVPSFFLQDTDFMMNFWTFWQPGTGLPPLLDSVSAPSPAGSHRFSVIQGADSGQVR